MFFYQGTSLVYTYVDAKNTLVCIYQYTKNALIFFLMFDLKIVFGYTRWEGSATDS